MIAKTTTGSDFEGALTYGAGQRQGRGKEPGEAPLLVVANVIPGSPKEMAQDMQAVAARSKRVQKPVWHTVLSWKAGEVVSQAQKVAAAKRYCELMGAPIDRHQVVVYEHRDKKHAHVHIYLNRVPIDGGPALRTDNNFYRQPAITRQISQELGMDPLPERRRSLKALDPTKEAARQRVSQALAQLLRQTDRAGEQWLALQLQKLAIEIRYTHDKGGVLRGVSFEMDGVALRGQEVGYKGAQLREALAAPAGAAMEHKAEHEARPEVLPALPQTLPPQRPKPARRKGHER
ncbi:relaxase/mobilization nuclease domain-containing protein [Hymenobacter weizhouensis]|uniref:relaxase/mobilization nuclease domain-containing protein n=1 Tax=Hymenobacter sp. YIM 151500-1 TaxID=2987689 RepID=UPI0022279BF0|nr:relaxase/mobilization nuclease domain-containing protein [Hymenobacter sp. YIM 151500-1]UYZ65317.1 relaxase/mobilization nuclease domain-containing protein [Hymenobacter sp. YIM 151500-1]